MNLITIGNRLTHLKLVDLSLQTVMDVKGALCKITITSENVDKILSAIKNIAAPKNVFRTQIMMGGGY